MHRLAHHENEQAPCNVYCDGDTHVDVIYLADWLVAQSGPHLLGVLQRTWTRRGFDAESIILELGPAPEGARAQDYYPETWHVNAHQSQPYRVTYRLVRPQE